MKSCFRDWPFVCFSGGFISHLFGDYANINMWKSDYMKAWNYIKNDFGRFVENQIQWPLCWKQKISRKGKGIFHNNANYRERWGLLIFTNILLLEQHVKPDDTHPALPPPHKHTHTNKNDTVCLKWPLPFPPPAHTNFFPIPITTNAQVFLSHC